MKATDDFKQWFDRYLEHWVPFCKTYIEEGKRTEAVLMIISKGGTDMAVLPAPMNTPTQKNHVMAIQKIFASDEDLVDAAVLATEAWSLEVKLDPNFTDEQRKAEIEKFYKEPGGIGDNPDKTEVLIWSAMRGTQQLIAQAPILKVATLSEAQDDELKVLSTKETLGDVVIADPFDKEASPGLKGRMINDNKPPAA